MRAREQLQVLLEQLLGSRNVYFQPPESIKLKYPAIVYSRSDIRNNFADNSVYNQTKAYQIIVIDANPDSKIVDKVAALSLCSFDRHYTSENLNHDVFTLYY